MKPSGKKWDVEPEVDDRLSRSLALIGSFYDACKVGYQGNEGYRKSTDLRKFSECIRELLSKGFIDPNRTVFTDLGCADGRVNVMMSYFVRTSIGIEIDPDILAEYEPRKEALLGRIDKEALEPPHDLLPKTAEVRIPLADALAPIRVFLDPTDAIAEITEANNDVELH